LRILCVGDSFTFGAGAKNGYSYPEQLQKLLDGEKLKYTVYNLGIPGTNSSTVLLNLPGWIELYKPRVVVLLIGANDLWNFQNSNYYLFQKDKRVYVYRLENFLFKFRTYKLLKLLLMSINKMFYGEKKNPTNFAPIKKLNPEVENNLKLAWGYFGQERDFNKVKEILRKVLILDPENDSAIYLLSCIYFDSNETELAEANFKKAIEINPYNVEAHRQLFRFYRHLNKNELAKKELEAMLKISPEDEELKKLKKFGIPYPRDEDLIFRQLKYNLMQAINLLKSNRIIFILQTYPRPYPSYVTRIKDISRDYNIPLVDNEAAFANLEYKDYFVSDGHPNERGYSVIAKNVFELIRKINDKTAP
jgi:lysophospholipase L1-like esterase